VQVFYRQFFGILTCLPLVAGWYGADVICLIPFLFKNVRNSALVKAVPLSDTTVSGKPCVANTDLNTGIFPELVEDTTCASIHFECESTNTKKIFPIKDPAWSMWILDQGRVGHSHGCKAIGAVISGAVGMLNNLELSSP
jgi:hypothetical protein